MNTRNTSIGQLSVVFGAALALAGCFTTHDDVDNAALEVIINNGLSRDSLTVSGLRALDSDYAGLSAAALDANQTWRSWMSQDADASDTFAYLVACALESGQTVSAVTIGNQSYGPWSGAYGLAPTWANGATQTDEEQQLVTACLLARTNAYALKVAVSSRSVAFAPPTAEEVAEYSVAEGQFFGNLFAATPVKGACRADGANAASNKQLTDESRVCAMNPAQCGFTDYGACSAACTDYDTIQGMYTSCGGYETVATYVDPLD